MTTSERGYTMTARVLGRLKCQRGVDVIRCHSPQCGKPILVNQEVVSKEGQRLRHFYHEKCYLNSFIEVTV